MPRKKIRENEWRIWDKDRLDCIEDKEKKSSFFYSKNMVILILQLFLFRRNHTNKKRVLKACGYLAYFLTDK